MSVDVNKITKNILKELGSAVPPDQSKQKQTVQQKDVERATTKTMLDAEQYAGILKNVLLTPKVTSANRLKALLDVLEDQSVASSVDRAIKSKIQKATREAPPGGGAAPGAAKAAVATGPV